MVREGRYAAIDIGTVTCRMLVADVSKAADGLPVVEPVLKEYAVTNLGEGVDATHRLSHAALARVAEAVDGFAAKLREFDTHGNLMENTLVMATSASRDAENSADFAALMEERGFRLNVISGSTEAMMSFMGASSAFAGECVAVVDVGGGSTEVSMGVAGEEPSFSHSFDVGCRRVTERFWDRYPPSAEALASAREWVREQFEPVLGGRLQNGVGEPGEGSENPSETQKRPEGPHIKAREWSARAAGEQRSADSVEPAPGSPTNAPFRMLAVAGTATSAVSIRERMRVYDSARVHGAVVTAADLSGTCDALAAMTLDELQRVVGLDPRRAPVIVAGMVILQEVMSALGSSSFTASESDILEGMIMYNAMAGHAGN